VQASLKIFVLRMHKVDYGGNIGLRIFKQNEVSNETADIMGGSKGFQPHALGTMFRTLSSFRVEQLILSKIPQPIRAQYAAQLGDCKLAILQVGNVRYLGTAVTFFDGFKLALSTVVVKDNNGNQTDTWTTRLAVSNPALLRQAVTLQILDRLCNQVDRHPGNIMIDVPHLRLVGIDHDFSFGTRNDISICPPLPSPFWDKDYSAAVGAVQQTEVTAATAGLTAAENAACWQRFVAFNTAYAATQPAQRATGANAANGERLWSQLTCADFPWDQNLVPANQQSATLIAAPYVRANALKKGRNALVNKGGVQCLAFTIEDAPNYARGWQDDGLDLPFMTIGQR
jgi:hypothetical protein